ncbi:MAG: B12-binding domain-containing radical SAM protein [Candidatus Omnitrophica bacterium]|nr:B12-binding domain-containing radical SAM protein [Candidatus Omnitrophota bacterium]
MIDENIESIDFSKDYDLVALSAITQQAMRAYKIADEFKAKGVKVVMGGIHPTMLPKEAKKHCDTVIVGEAEESWPQFIKDFLKNKIQSFYYSSSPANLESSPLPRYDLLKPGNYKVIWMQATRGCPYDCEFCVASRVFGTKFRHKSIKQVIREIKLVKTIFKNCFIGFGDDNMFIDKRYALELVEKLIPLKIKWVAQTDISIAEDSKLLALLKKGGCHMLFIGFESLSDKSLMSINKMGFKLKRLHKYETYVKKIHSFGIGIVGAFILGFDSDDVSAFKKTADFIIDNHLYPQITILTPLPGTRLRARLEQENRLLSFDWDNYTFWDANFMPRQISIDELQKGLLGIYRAVYNKKVLLENDRYFKRIYSIQIKDNE